MIFEEALQALAPLVPTRLHYDVHGGHVADSCEYRPSARPPGPWAEYHSEVREFSRPCHVWKTPVMASVAFDYHDTRDGAERARAAFLARHHLDEHARRLPRPPLTPQAGLRPASRLEERARAALLSGRPDAALVSDLLAALGRQS